MANKPWCQQHRLKRSRFGGDAGQTLVETAFVIAFLIPLLLGAVEFGSLAYASIEVSNAARAAVQYGASSRAASADTTGITLAAQNDAKNLSTLTVPVVSVSCTCANSSYTPSSCTDNSTCLNGNTTMEETLTVQTQATVVALIRIPKMSNTFTLKGHAVQKVVNQ